MNIDLNIEKILLACQVKAGTGTNEHRNRPSHGLTLFLGGERTFVFEGGKKLKVCGSTVVYFPKSSNYSIINKSYSDCYAINFQSSDCLSSEAFAFKTIQSERLLEHFKSAVSAWNSSSVGRSMQVKAELYGIICKMQKEYSAESSLKKGNKLLPVIEYINKKYLTENIGVGKLAKLCGISEVYLRRLFSEHYGISPNRYIKQKRIERAKELILSGIYTSAEVCYLSGFNDESYFSREFKKYTSVTPGEYPTHLQNQTNPNILNTKTQ